MTQQTIVAHFDSRSDAERAIEALASEGVARSSIRMLPDAESTNYSRSDTSASYDRSRDEGGFWASLGNLFLPNEDRYAYAEGMSRGGVTLSITADAAQIDRIADIAERHGAVDMDEREQSWRQEGWTGYSSGTTDAASASTTTGLTGTAEGMAMGATGASAVTTGMGSTGETRMAATQSTTGEEVIPVVEEELRVGKRQVNSGRVRVRSYVVETPVEEQVNLREEHVHVERRPVDRTVTAADDVFAERTIEAEEHAEEAVVSKHARVTEELVVRKDVADRTETVRDTVRRTEVDVEDDRRTGSVDRTASGSGTTRDPL